ncbi:MAG TPA: TonB-dependent receptor [Prolixibacteraceae bacterium]|nr:TonB-dependent receptor [Prolixibacteraceae bacterium]
MKVIISGYIMVIMMVMATLGLSGQNTISGVVRGSGGETLAGAHIIIKNTTLGTASDALGQYRLKGLRNGVYTLRVSYFGYQTQEREVELSGREVVLDFEMEETSVDLNAVVVTGTRTEKSLSNTPVLTQSVGIRELVSRDATDITQALEMVVPGMEFASTAAGKSLTLQGIDPQYTVFLVDGERIAGDTYGDIDYSRINMADVERIEVVKGAGSTLYGSNALGGVVNIITRTPSEVARHSASARFSGYNTQNYQLSSGMKWGRISSQTSVVMDKTEGYDLLKGNTYRTQEREDAVVVNQKLRYTFSPEFLVEGKLSYMDKNHDNTAEQLYDRNNRNLAWGARATWFPGFKNDLTLSWHSDHYELFNKITPDSLVNDYDNRYNNARLLGNFRLAEWNLLTVGTEYIQETLTAARNNIAEKNNSDYILFAQEDLQATDNLNFTGGFRAHHNSLYGWHFTPQVSAMYHIWHFTFRGNYGLGYKTPTLKEKYMSYKLPVPGPPMYLLGNEDLKPEDSRFASLSMEYTRKGVSFSVSAFHNDISGMITEDLDEYNVKPGGIIEYTYRNYDHVTVRGIDVLLKTKVFRDLLFTGALSFSKKYDEIDNKAFDNVRNFTGKFNADYRLTAGDYGLNVNLQSNLYGKKKLNLMDDRTHQTTVVDLERFSLWKLTTTHTFISHYYLKAGIDNIFDYTDPSGGYNTGTPGRQFFLGIGVNF